MKINQKIIIILAFLPLSTYSQDFTNISMHTNLHNVNGVEVKQVFTDWYATFFLTESKEKRVDWGFGIGYYIKSYLFDYSGGFKIALPRIKGVNSPLYGLEVDLIHNASDAFFIGLKTGYNRINYINENSNFINELNLTVKVGIRL